ncbi:hypothetical protein EMIT0347P_20531 [Pseudomonas sp. IT-347P]
MSQVGVAPEHPPISSLSLWERARVRGFCGKSWYLLMREGCAILNVIQARAVQREEAYKTPV